MYELNVIVETAEVATPVAADIIELSVEELGEVGGGVAYVLM